MNYPLDDDDDMQRESRRDSLRNPGGDDMWRARQVLAIRGKHGDIHQMSDAQALLGNGQE